MNGRLLLAVLGLGFTAAAMAEVNTKVSTRIISEHTLSDVSHALAYSSGYIFAGRNRSTLAEQNRVEVIDGKTLTVVTYLNLSHTAAYAYAFGPHKTLILGYKSQDIAVAQYTIVTESNGKFTAKTTELPLEVQFEQFSGDPSRMFFIDMGDARAFQLKGNEATTMGSIIHGPMGIAATDKYLFVIEDNLYGSGDENLVRVDIATGETRRVFPEYRGGILRVTALPATKQIAIDEYFENQVLIIDQDTNKLAHTLAVPAGTPMALATYGSCLAVLSDESRHVTFFDIASYKQVNEWDLSTVGTRFKQGHEMTVDNVTGRIYARSSGICANCPETTNSVVVAEDLSGETQRLCKIAQ